MSPKPVWARTVAEIQSAATAAGRARLGCCAIEGTRVFERALRAGVAIPRAVASAAFVAQEDDRARALQAELRGQGCELVEAPPETLHELTAGRSIGAIVGLAELPRERTLAELLAEPRSRRPGPILLGAVGQDDPGNAGALVRTAHALGAGAFLAIGAVDPFHPRAVRTSMGSVFRLPVLRFADLDAGVDALRAADVRTLGAVTEGGTPLAALAPRAGPVAALLGSEAFGLSKRERARLDDLVTIPMQPGVDSLSINAAAAVLLYGLG